MLCTRCNSQLKPVVALDIDGTLADYHGDFEQFASRWIGRPPSGPGYRGREPYWAWFTTAFDVDRTTFRTIKLAYRQGGMKRFMPVYPRAVLLAEQIRDLGAELWLTTSRPHDRFDRVDPDTREWLHRNDIQFDGLLYSDRKMIELSERVDCGRVVMVLDDLLPVLEEASSIFGAGVPVLRRTRYNQAVDWNTWILNLDDAIELAEYKINQWKEVYANA